MKNNNRTLESLLPLIDETFHSEQKFLWLSSPSDIGVRRNFGRNGTRFAPRAILNCFKKLNNHSNQNDHLIFHQTVSSQENEKVDFHQAQDQSSSRILKLLSDTNISNIIHIGGGHDHAYPMLKALEESGIEELVILNVDAHLDTRIDEIRHSGTPFRDFSKETKIKVFLHQFGIHDFANSNSTMSELKNVNQTITFRKDCKNTLDTFKEINWKNPKLALFFSLDTDALDGSLFEGVSAVNHDGLALNQVKSIMHDFFDKTAKAKKVLGIYEYNPLFDNLSQKGARAIASIIYEFLKR